MDHKEKSRNTDINIFPLASSFKFIDEWICRGFSPTGMKVHHTRKRVRIKITWLCCHTQVGHNYQQQELLCQMLHLAHLFSGHTEMHHSPWERVCGKDKVLAYSREAIKGLHISLEGRAGLKRLLSQLPCFETHKGSQGSQLSLPFFQMSGSSTIPHQS